MKLSKAKIVGTISIVAGLLVFLALWYFFVYKPRRDAKRDPSKYKEENKSLWFGCNDDFPIVMGSCGPRVKTLQKYFNKKLTAAGITQLTLGNLPPIPVPIVEDGLFGQKTYAAATRVINNIYWLKPASNNMDAAKWTFWTQFF